MDPKQYASPLSADGVIRPQPVAASAAVQPLNAAVTPTPSAPGAPVPSTNQPPTAVGGGQPPLDNLPAGQPPKPKRRRRLIIGLIISLLIIAGVLAYVFLIFVPNRPQNVWSTGLNRTGDTLQKLVDSASEQATLDSFKKSEITGSIDVSGADITGNGTMSARFDDANLDGALNFAFQGPDGESYKQAAKFKAALADGQEYPDVFFQLSGLSELGADAFLPGISAYDNKWVTIDSATTKQFVDSLTEESTGEALTEVPTGAEYAELAKTIVRTTNEYVFTDAEDKAVFNRDQFVGKETTSQGVAAYHYKATVNRDNAKKFCEAIVTNVMATAAFKKMVTADQQTDEARKTTITDCQKTIDEDIQDKSFDLWIDGKYKMLHKIKLESADTAGDYVEFGQSYKGDDTIPFFATFHSDKDKFDVTVTNNLDTKTYKSSGAVTIDYTGDNAIKAKLTYTAAPYSGAIDSTKPDGAVPIQQVFEELGIPLEADTF